MFDKNLHLIIRQVKVENPDELEILKVSFPKFATYAYFPDYKKIYLAIVAEKMVGYAEFNQIFEICDVVDFEVAENFRGQGFGNLLFKNSIETLIKNGVKEISLEVRESNFPAIKIYKNTGFSEAGKRENYYKNPDETAILMIKQIL